MVYRDAIVKAMEMLAEDPRTVFIGYNLKFGSKGYKTLINIPEEKIIEMPVAENLMSGLGMGMSLGGFRPVVIFERHDFVLNALDNLVNHLSKINELSCDQYNPDVLIRAIVGRTTPINPGPQHRQDFTEFFKKYLSFPVHDPRTKEEVRNLYRDLKDARGPHMIIERSELYKK